MIEPEITVVFPGQGSQRPGMGRDFYEQLSVCRDTYKEASDAVGWDVASLCFGDDERLNLTEYTQPCILTTEIAMLRGIASLFGLSPALFGGHSLGEFAALVAVDALPLADAVRIVQARGRLMQEATPVGIGGMAAIISENLDVSAVDGILMDLPVDIANVNSAHQVVISGSADALPKAAVKMVEILEGDREFRFVPLHVSAPFHSRFMRPVEGPFEEILRLLGKSLDPKKADRVTSNYSGDFHEGCYETLVRSLVRQMSSTVRWHENMANLAGRSGVVYEIGPTRTLREFFKTVGVNCVSISTFSAAMRILGSSN